MTGMSPIMLGFHRLQFGAIARAFLAQPVSFWLVCTYLLFEYVRPQSIYPSLDILPWTQWTIFACAAAVAIEGKLFKRFDAADGWFAIFTAILIASCFTAYKPNVAFGELWVFLLWVLIYVLITRSVDTEVKYFLFFFAFLLFSLKMSQHATLSWFGAGMRFRTWGATGAPGWFHNSGELGIQMAVFFPLAAYFALALKPYLEGMARKWKYWFVLAVPFSAVTALLASSSRGGQIGLAAVGAFMLFRSKERVRGFLIAGIVGALAFLALPAEQKTRFTEMGDDETSQQRLTHWENGWEIIQAHPVLGVGYNNWYDYYVENGYDTGQGSQLSHNIFIQATSELGYLGLAGFLGMIFMTFRMNAATRRRAARLPNGRTVALMAMGLDAALVGYLVSGSFVTVFFYPYFWINYAMTAALCRTTREKANRVGRGGARPRFRGARPTPRRLADAPTR